MSLGRHLRAEARGPAGDGKPGRLGAKCNDAREPPIGPLDSSPGGGKVSLPMVTKSSSRDQVAAALARVLQDVQQISGCKCPSIEDATKPMEDLEGFDSLRGLEVTVMLEAKLGVSAGAKSLFISPSGNVALPFSSIVDAFFKLVESQRAA